MHLGRDGDVGKEGVVPAHENAATFKVLDDVEDLLALRLPHHSTYVQQGGDMLLPVGSRDAKRKRSTKVLADAGFFVALPSAVIISEQRSRLSESEELFLVKPINFHFL